MVAAAAAGGGGGGGGGEEGLHPPVVGHVGVGGGGGQGQGLGGAGGADGAGENMMMHLFLKKFVFPKKANKGIILYSERKR